MQRLFKIQEDLMLGKCTLHNANDDFMKSLCICCLANERQHPGMLSVPQSPSSCVIRWNQISIFSQLQESFVTRFEATLEGLPVDVRIRTSTVGKKNFYGLTPAVTITFIVQNASKTSVHMKWQRSTKSLLNRKRFQNVIR
jgi:hypothetical protein